MSYEFSFCYILGAALDHMVKITWQNAKEKMAVLNTLVFLKKHHQSSDLHYSENEKVAYFWDDSVPTYEVRKQKPYIKLYGIAVLQ